MSWCFAKVNNRLAEIFFDEGKNREPLIIGHCCVRKDEYKTKKEQKWINDDTKKVKIAYRNKKYRLSGGIFYNPKYQTYASKKFAKIEGDIKKGKNLAGPFNNADDAIKFLNLK